MDPKVQIRRMEVTNSFSQSSCRYATTDPKRKDIKRRTWNKIYQYTNKNSQNKWPVMFGKVPQNRISNLFYIFKSDDRRHFTRPIKRIERTVINLAIGRDQELNPR
jgi:hypothetical protein